MKRKVCIIGNSHAGALKRAWDLVPEWHSANELTFFAARANGMRHLHLKGHTLIPRSRMLKESIRFTSGGLDSINVSDYDTFLIYGLQMEAFFIEPGSFFSAAVIRQSLLDSVDSTLSFNILKMIRSVTDKSIYIGHSPLLTMNSDEDWTYSSEDYLSGVRLMNDEVLSSYCATLIAQPSATIVNGIFTKSEFLKGSKRLSVGDNRDDQVHPDHDDRHMNDTFGREWLSHFFEQVSAGTSYRSEGRSAKSSSHRPAG
ncbi:MULTISPECIES: hypothetical protein [unclassified Halomonas]|uniref:hypothetical protein n=1 Tax=unclassified Halomonas TaxID=2609666 RepID=UPI001C970DBF|nr:MULTISPECIES: hypothetical protein [unclassified Halomonas]MBY5927083.1 hypothetical protein [Halomonas sp. DP4Y7-2]MBY6234125.1 hypothetical protein [Halomonas sp. DP4Y7-1]